MGRPEDGTAHGYESCFCEKHSHLFLESTEGPGGWTNCAADCPGRCGAYDANFSKCLPVATRTGHVDSLSLVGAGEIPPPLPLMRSETYAFTDRWYACVCRAQRTAGPIVFVYGIPEMPKGTYTWGGIGCSRSCSLRCRGDFNADEDRCVLAVPENWHH